MAEPTHVPSVARPAPAPVRRFRSLDGLRGVAALVVLVHHVALTSPTVGSMFIDPDAHDFTAVERAWLFSPLYALWAGREAVLLFFVLSGFVLAIRSARGGHESWRSYYPRRLVRLYVPALASLLLAYASVRLVARTVIPGASVWLNEMHAEAGNTVGDLVRGSTLLVYAGGLNTPLWSLRWEVLFSLLLPVYLVLANRLRRWALPIAAGFVVLTVLGCATGLLQGALLYMPVFGVGVALAYASPRLEAWASRVTRAGWWALGVTGLVLFVAQGLLGALVATPSVVAPYGAGLAVVGSALLVAVAAWCPAAERVLTTRLLARAGLVSFSLYLTHEPLAVSVAYALGGDAPLWLVMVIVVPTALVLGDVFFRLVERPSHALSRVVGAWFERGAAAPAAAAVVEEDPDELALATGPGGPRA